VEVESLDAIKRVSLYYSGIVRRGSGEAGRTIVPVFTAFFSVSQLNVEDDAICYASINTVRILQLAGG
jgi:hypothetical protein